MMLCLFFFFVIFSKGQLSGGDGVSYDFNMASLADHLKKQSEQGPSTYYNIDIIKYEVRKAINLVYTKKHHPLAMVPPFGHH